MIGRRRFLLTSLAGGLAVPLAAGAQQAGPVRVVGIMVGRPEASRSFEQSLRELKIGRLDALLAEERLRRDREGTRGNGQRDLREHTARYGGGPPSYMT